MQIDHRLAAGGLMQAIHVLGEQHFQLAARFQRSERVMGGVGLRQAEPRPTDQAARPIALPRGQLAHKGLKRHRLRTLPAALQIPIIGNARIGAATGTGEHEQALMALDEVLQRVVVVGGDSSHLAIPETMGALCTGSASFARYDATSAAGSARAQ